MVNPDLQISWGVGGAHPGPKIRGGGGGGNCPVSKNFLPSLGASV